MEKKTYTQLSFNFDDTEDNDKPVETTRHKVSMYKCFPKEEATTSLWEMLSVTINEIDAYLTELDTTLSTAIFHSVFVEGQNRKEIIESLRNSCSARIPTSERVRQIAEQMAEELATGKRVKLLDNVKLREDVIEWIDSTKNGECGLYVDSCTLNTVYKNMFKGFSLLLSANIIEHDTVLPMLKGYFLLPKSVFRETFKSHYLAVYFTMQELVRPVSYHTFIEELRQRRVELADSLNCDLVKLVLKDSDVFERVKDEEGQDAYWIKYEYLTNAQQQARIIYEFKSITSQNLIAEMRHRGNNCKSFSLSLTHRKYPWCVPMGKTQWVYRTDETQFERVQDVIEKYCRENIRFTMDLILDYLKSRDYDMKESSVRSYITKHCRPLNADGNTFCLTEAVPAEEDHLWQRKAVKYTRPRVVEYQEELNALMLKTVAESNDKRILRSELKKIIVPFLQSRNLSRTLFYKHLEKHPELKLVDEDGEVFVVVEKS